MALVTKRLSAGKAGMVVCATVACCAALFAAAWLMAGLLLARHVLDLPE